MHKAIKISQEVLNDAFSDWEYLQIILDVYNDLQIDEPNAFLDNFTDEQVSFFVYGILLKQVENGGFYQLLLNGYATAVFESPLIETLTQWGAKELAVFLCSIRDTCLSVGKYFSTVDSSAHTLVEIHSLYPDFEGFDRQFHQNNGTEEVRQYVEAHLANFIRTI